MWTPKRIVILAGGLVLFCSVYGIYAYFLGGIDGLPELPPLYAECTDSPLPPLPPEGGTFDKKLRLAFNDACPEVYRAIKLDFKGKGYGLAANRFEPEPDGRADGGRFAWQDRDGRTGPLNVHRRVRVVVVNPDRVGV